MTRFFPEQSGAIHLCIDPPSTGRSTRRHRLALFVLVACLAVLPAEGYIGPGAGFALASSFAVILTTIVVAAVAILILPLRLAIRALRRPKREKERVRRVIVVGFDGQDPRLTDRFMGEGKMPNFQKLADSGCYHRLETTYPAISPVAWSTYATGTQPAKHNIYDFLSRDKRTYLPQLSSTEIGSIHKSLKIGKWEIPLHKPELRLLRKSKPFWKILGEHHIWSTVLRVPITFPPDDFYGAELSAMATPDMLGTQGTFLLFTTRSAKEKFKEGGAQFEFVKKGENRYEANVEGPPNTFLQEETPLVCPLVMEVDRAAGSAKVTVGKEEITVTKDSLCEWVKLEFPAAPLITVSGLCRMQITEMDEEISLYMTPICFDPENPAMPISHPSYYSNYLAQQIGPYSTLGLAEDTWALNEDVVDDSTFLQQSYDIDEEREKMFFKSLDRLSFGTLSCVFDGTDRIQHMFWRYMEEGHPAGVGKEDAEHKDAIEKLYEHNDALLGRIVEKVKPDDLLMVLSDHGFASFRRCVNLNAWLLENGYLHLKEGADGSTEWLQDVDWSKTKAYALGLIGMYINVKGREEQGIVEPGEEAQALKAELIEKLRNLRDEEKDEIGVNEIFDTSKLYQGPYLGNAPDFVVGFNEGYRTSWDCATGMISGPIFEDNLKAWSGDHGIDPRLVPGVFFCNQPITENVSDEKPPGIVDLAPTILELFGVRPPAHMDGKALFAKDANFLKKQDSLKKSAPSASAG